MKQFMLLVMGELLEDSTCNTSDVVEMIRDELKPFTDPYDAHWGKLVIADLKDGAFTVF